MKLKHWMIVAGVLFLLAMSAYCFAAPFLASNAYTAGTAQPTEFLVSLDDGEEVSSAAVGHKYTFTLTAYDAATTYGITIGGASVTQVGTAGTTTTTATALTTALNASVNENFTPITWTSSGAVITGTADHPNGSFAPTTTETGGAGTIGDAVATENLLKFDVEGLQFGEHTATVKAQNETTTGGPSSLTFNVGIETPDIILLPVAP